MRNLPHFEGLSNMTSQWKKKKWDNFLSRRDFDLLFFFSSCFFEGFSVEKIKLYVFPGVQYPFKGK